MDSKRDARKLKNSLKCTERERDVMQKCKARVDERVGNDCAERVQL